MFYLFVVDYLIGLLISCFISFKAFDSIDYFIYIYPFILVIISFLREHEAKVRGRLKVIERNEFLKRYNNYDNYVYVCNLENKKETTENNYSGVDTL